MKTLSVLAAALAVAILPGCSAPDYGAYTASYVSRFDIENPSVKRSVSRPDGLRIDAREFGSAHRGQGPTIVLMHGFPDSQHLYDAVVPELAKTRHVVTFDFVGWGDSDKPAQHRYDGASLRADIDAVIASFQPESVVLVVHDMSGPPGIEWALDNESRVAALVLLNTYYSPMPALKPPEAIARYSTPGFMRDLNVWGANHSDAAWQRGVEEQTGKFFADPAARTTYDKVFVHQALGIRPAFFGENAVLQEETAKRLAETPRLKAFARPVDIVFGADDPYLNTGVANAFRALFPNGELHLVAHAAHYVQLDRPEDVAARILAANGVRVAAAPGVASAQP